MSVHEARVGNKPAIKLDVDYFGRNEPAISELMRILRKRFAPNYCAKSGRRFRKSFVERSNTSTRLMAVSAIKVSAQCLKERCLKERWLPPCTLFGSSVAASAYEDRSHLKTSKTASFVTAVTGLRSFTVFLMW